MTNRAFKKITILILILFVLLGILPSSFQFLNKYKLNANENVEFWNPESDSFDSNIIKEVENISNYVTFTTFKNNIESIDQTYLDNYKIIVEDANDLYTLSKESFINVLSSDSKTNKLKYLNGNYVLGRDIDYDEASSKSLFFTPIGNEAYPFNGSFDGNGFEIKNLFFISISNYTEYETYYSGLKYMSFFGNLSSTAFIRNFGLVNLNMILVSTYDILENASYLVGQNDGYIENTYVLDTREVSGMACEGGYNFAGLVIMNNGTIKNSYVSSKRVSSLEVNMKLSVSPCITFNTGIVENVYFDKTIYLETGFVVNSSVVGLATSELNNPSINKFKDYYYANSFSNITLNVKYPYLKGLKEEHISGSHYKYIISNEIEFMYMFELINNYAYFRNKEFVLDACIDFSKLSRDSFKGLKVSFDGKFSSNTKEISDTCDHDVYDKGEKTSLYHTIRNLKIYSGNLVDNKYVYGLFGYATGVFENFNILNAEIYLNDVDKLDAYYDVGILMGYSRETIVENVRVSGKIDFENSKLISNSSFNKTISNLSVGGLIGRGISTINNSSTNGSIMGCKINTSSNFNNSAIGGIIGTSDFSSITNSTASMNITSFSFLASSSNIVYYGGIAGKGTFFDFNRNYSIGQITAKVFAGNSSGNINLYIGGSIGLLNEAKNKIFQVTTKTDIHLAQENSVNARISGFANINSSKKIYLTSINSKFSFYGSSLPSLTEAMLNDTIVKFTYGINLTDTNAVINGINVFEPETGFNSKFDLAVIHEFSANLLIENINSGVEKCDLTNSVNKTNNNFVTENILTMNYIKISNNIIGKNINMQNISSQGYINVLISHRTTKRFRIFDNEVNGAFVYKEFKVFQLFEEISMGYTARNLTNSGDIMVKTAEHINLVDATRVRFNFLISGLGYKNGNTQIYQDNGILPEQIKVDSSVKGSLDNCINYGNIYADLNIYGQSRIGGIVNINSSMISNAFNFGDIYNRNAVQATGGTSFYSEGQFEVETGGICYLMNERYAQIKDSINSGNIISISTTSEGWVNSSGIAIRNDKREDGKSVTSSENKPQLAKIQFSANYGNVVAYNYVNESDSSSTREYRNKSSGILAMGLLSVINVVNYGNIYGKYTASGIYAHVALGKFSIAPKETYVSNSLNYGKIRQIVAVSTGIFYNPIGNDLSAYKTAVNNMNDYVMADGVNVISSTNYAIGAAIGLIDFNNAIDNATSIEFSYLINFDKNTDVVGSAAAVPSDFPTIQIAKITKYMATVKTDTSPTPFVGIKKYSMSTASDGVFDKSFPLRNPPLYSGVETDKYISDYVQFVPYSKVNTPLLEKIEFNRLGVTDDTIGIYALSSSSGIQHGVFLPDNINLEALNISKNIGEENYNEFVVNELNLLKQLKLSISTEVFDLELVNTDDSTIKLNNPLIDSFNKTLTYHISENQLGSTAPSCGAYCETGEFSVPGEVDVEKDSTGAPIFKYELASNYVNVGQFVTNLFNTNSQMTSVRIYNNSNDKNAFTEYNKLDKNNATTLGKRIYKIIKNASTGKDESTFVTVGYFLKNDSSSEEFWGNSLYAGNYNITLQNRTFLDNINGVPRYYENIADDTETEETLSYAVYGSGEKKLNAQTLIGDNLGQYIKNGTNNYSYGGPREGFENTKIKYQILKPGPNKIVTLPLLYSNFRINFDSNYKLAFNASIKNDYTLIADYGYGKYASVPRYIREEENEDFEDKLGKFSIIAEDKSVVQEYTIVIKRTIDKSAVLNDSLKMDGANVIGNISSSSDLNNIELIDIKMKYNSGLLEIGLDLENFKNNYNLLSSIQIYEFDSITGLYHVLNPRGQMNINGKIITFDNYVLSGGIVNNPNDKYDNGSLGSSKCNILFSMNNYTKGGKYKIEINISKNQVMSLVFEKEQSPEGKILDMTYDNMKQDTSNSSIVSNVQIGKHYVDTINDNSMNFNDLLTIKEVDFDLLHMNLPDYLNNLEISIFSKLKEITFHVEKISNKYVYKITYYIESEQGIINTFVHEIKEVDYLNTIKSVYQDGNKLPLVSQLNKPLETSFLREENPNYRVEYNLDDFYIPNNDFLSVLNTDRTVEIFILKNIGFDVYFSQEALVSEYIYGLRYSASTTVLENNLTWDIDFQALKITKNANINSYLTNIKFVSDTIYSGLNTIMDNELITVSKYQDLLSNPENRKIAVLPSKIYYNNVESLNNKFYCIGQVQKTNLSNYSPSFVIPEGASIYRVDSFGTEYGDGTVTSGLLKTEYVFTNDVEFLFTKYRVYAENRTYFTEYFIAIQDLTYNIKFDIEINLARDISSTELDRVFISLINFKDDEFGNPIMTSNTIESKTSFFSHYSNETGTFINTSLPSNKSGGFKIVVDLSKKFSFDYVIYDAGTRLDISAEHKKNNLFVIPSSIVSKKYKIVINIFKSTAEDSWGIGSNTGI